MTQEPEVGNAVEMNAGCENSIVGCIVLRGKSLPPLAETENFHETVSIDIANRSNEWKRMIAS